MFKNKNNSSHLPTFRFGAVLAKSLFAAALTLSLPLEQVAQSAPTNHDFLCTAMRLSQQKYTQTHQVNRPIAPKPKTAIAKVVAPATKMLYNTKAKIKELTYQIAKNHGVDPHLVQAIIQTESNFNPSARSPDGAQGLMQLSKDTARRLGVKNPFDPVENIQGGSRYLKKMLTMFKNDHRLALAAYNAGPGNVQKYKGVPPFQTTQGYIKKVLSAYNKFQGPSALS